MVNENVNEVKNNEQIFDDGNRKIGYVSIETIVIDG
jgi:hypothetical protein